MIASMFRSGFLLLLASGSAVAGTGGPYDVALIPAGLRREAAAVVREDRVRFEIFARGSAELTRTVAYTVFNRDGREFGLRSIPYDRFSEVKELEGALYDRTGEEIRTLDADDVKDLSDISAYSLYEDSRVRNAELYHDQYPYTVEFRYRIRYGGILNYPRWVAQPSGEPVVRSSFEVVMPAAEELRYWTSADTLRPSVTVTGGERRYLWSASELPELSEDELEEDVEKRTSVVRIAPREFELADRPGTMTDWRAFGAWAGALFAGKGSLPPRAREEVAALLGGTTGAREKAARLYRFLQDRSRYVNVTLGIGGWEPYDAAYVYERGYGDCKALSNFMIALLAEAGIRAYPALIEAGGSRSTMLPDFPSAWFNHVIVCVPSGSDSLWLECTSKAFPFAYLGSFTENRPALLLTQEGGVLVRTPASTSRENVLARGGRVEIRGFGDAVATLRILREGNRSEWVRTIMLTGSAQEKDRWTSSEVGVSGATVKTCEVSGVKDHSLRIEEVMSVDLPRFAPVSGRRLFFQPNLTNRNASSPAERRGRKSPIRFLYPRCDLDSILYVLPRGAVRESLPAAITMRASFGTFQSSSVAVGDSAILYTRRLDILTSEIAPDRYPEYVKFMTEVVKADRAQAVLRVP